ncbi:hypothetical protein CYR40_21350 [Chimaeribacter arupi]|uniref:Alpha/beta hydrolase n=1 Tax=Chimaeribacter arupi TaxID=2060066 RepID=A0A2N5EH87_9GAMM|nr:hypothetical protein [Chimaeribacter arupi]PLR42144.1 hypothetical protein CYR40_21350 [Chimaeribacter arupi]PLR42919.1 hypothetical protein CYR34_21180 [Chimaeribacter arupi]
MESYQESGQHAVADLCRLDMPGGRLHLQHPERFLTLLGQEVPLAPSEPVQLLLDPPPPQITRLRCPVSYVITQQDELTPPQVQQAFARHLNARQLFWQGGHVAPMHTTDWLTAPNTIPDS